MSKINYRDPIWAVIVIALLFLFLWQNSERKRYKLEAEVAEAKLSQTEKEIQSTIDKAQARIDSSRSERVSDSLKQSLVISRLNASTAYWKKEAKKTRDTVLIMSDSVPVLKAYIAATDSVISKMDSTIQVQSGHIIAQSKLYQVEIAALSDKNIQAVALADLYKDEYIQQTKETKKQERRKRLWRGIAGVVGLVTVGVVLAQ